MLESSQYNEELPYIYVSYLWTFNQPFGSVYSRRKFSAEFILTILNSVDKAYSNFQKRIRWE